MKHFAFLLFLPLLAVPAAAQEVSAKVVGPQHVAFVGKPDDARTRAFVEFLKPRFDKVTQHSRYDVDPKELAKADVVVLDWPQSEGVLKWFQSKGKETPSSPLGARGDWATPTVLVGSAGLNLACAWNVKGGSG